MLERIAPVEGVQAGVAGCRPGCVALQRLAFEGRVEAFRERVVGGVADRAHALGHAGGLEASANAFDVYWADP